MNIITNKNKISMVMLSGVLLLALALRIYRLGHQSLWLDEVLNVSWSKINSVTEMIRVLSVSDNSPPLYYIVLHYWMKLGSNEFIIRLPSAIAGVIAVFTVFKIGEVILDRNTALLAAFLAAVSPFYLWISQEARMYAFVSMLSLSSFYFFIKAIKKNSVKLWLGYIVFSVLAIYTHYYALFTVFTEFIYFSWHARKLKHCIKNYLLSLIGIFLLFIPCLFFLFQQLLVSSRRVGGFFPSTIWAIPHAFFDFSTGYSLLQIELSSLFQNIYHNLSVIIFSGIIFITVFISGLVYIIRKKENANLILFYLFIPIIISFVISLKVHIFGSKYLVAPAGIYYLILAHGLKNLKLRLVSVIFTLGILIITGLSMANYYFNDNFAKGGWREAAKFVEENEKPGDVILFALALPSVPFEYYYRGQSQMLGIQHINSLSQGCNKIWFIPYLQDMYGADNKTREWLSKRGKIEREYKFESVSVISYILN